jgi:hypothetical protein
MDGVESLLLTAGQPLLIYGFIFESLVRYFLQIAPNFFALSFSASAGTNSSKNK